MNIPRGAKLRWKNANRSPVSKYEHFRELVPLVENVGHAPDDSKPRDLKYGTERQGHERLEGHDGEPLSEEEVLDIQMAYHLRIAQRMMMGEEFDDIVKEKQEVAKERENIEKVIEEVAKDAKNWETRELEGYVLESFRGSNPKIWMTRRRRDGKILLAHEFVDRNGVLEEVYDTLLGVLNHPNILSLVDIVLDADVDANALNYTVWEYADQGNLNRLLWNREGEDQIEIPEDFCWHVLEGISNALLWLHQGYTKPPDFNVVAPVDEDWHPILYGVLSPVDIFFCSPDNPDQYPKVKLGNFEKARVCAFEGTGKVLYKDVSDPYADPAYGRDGWGEPSEIWSLGAILHHMMTGAPPTKDQTDFKFPERYSTYLRELVTQMLGLHPVVRPGVQAVITDATTQRLRNYPSNIEKEAPEDIQDELTMRRMPRSGEDETMKGFGRNYPGRGAWLTEGQGGTDQEKPIEKKKLEDWGNQWIPFRQFEDMWNPEYGNKEGK
ncbi:MAG: hypothetical protein M1834_008253 [Cirrosporium novae-zelandiae]|nr:MAG: hypothetical protein M1834_008253 [Cirrosporium novae-zelandiae]